MEARFLTLGLQSVYFRLINNVFTLKHNIYIFTNNVLLVIKGSVLVASKR